MNDKPDTVRIKAIDVKPYHWALWCSVGGGKPFANTIEYRRWSEDGEYIWFGLDSHNHLKAAPDEVLELVPYRSKYVTDAMLAENDAKDAAKMAQRPVYRAPCPTCGHKKGEP